ncbi:MAG: sulfotransferase, partial [Candidatus Rokuibacteriota bacterium]
MKCFVLSLHRAGTRTTAAYLEALGVRTRHWPVDHDGADLQAKVLGHETDLEHVTSVLGPVLDRYDAVADVPIPVLYRQLLARYPEAKFLLLYRHAFDWLRSVRWKLRRGDFRPYVRTVYWTYFDHRPARVAELSDADLLW